MSRLVVKPIAQDVPPEIAHLLSFFDAPQIGAILKQLDWNLRKELTTLVGIAENSEKDGDKLKAMKAIREIQLAGAIGGGHIVSVTQTESLNDSSGRLTRQRTVTASRLTGLGLPATSAQPVIDLTPHLPAPGQPPGPQIVAEQGASEPAHEHPELGGPPRESPQGPSAAPAPDPGSPPTGGGGSGPGEADRDAVAPAPA